MTRYDHLIDTITSELQPHADPDYRELVRQRYTMNVDKFWGVRMPVIHKVANRHYASIKSLPIDQRLAACRHLLETRVYEHKIVAFRWGYRSRNDLDPSHLPVLRDWLNTYVDDWSDCDDLCIHVLGEFFLRHPDQATQTRTFTDSPNRWMRRGAAVSIILPVRKGMHLELALAIADRLMHDQDDLVQKGYGWLLKEASKTHTTEVFNYVMRHRTTMPRTALRYALEKMPADLRRTAMGK
jgi:3-methyladenine DNA glycosylase AlkD